MQRWCAILLLALLPLQFSWAAVAGYCAHESDAQVQHLGHHEHQHAGHAAAAQDLDPAGKTGPSALDLDCGHSHTTCCALPALVGRLIVLSLPSHPAVPVQGQLRTLAQDPPERPQWQRFA